MRIVVCRHISRHQQVSLQHVACHESWDVMRLRCFAFWMLNSKHIYNMFELTQVDMQTLPAAAPCPPPPPPTTSGISGCNGLFGIFLLVRLLSSGCPPLGWGRHINLGAHVLNQSWWIVRNAIPLLQEVLLKVTIIFVSCEPTKSQGEIPKS